jgi:hypothetical protein
MGRLDLPELQPLYRRFQRVPVVSISNAQREPVPWANFVDTVYCSKGALVVVEVNMAALSRLT